MGAFVVLFPPVIVFVLIFVKWTDEIIFSETQKGVSKANAENVVTTECYHLVRCKKCGEDRR